MCTSIHCLNLRQWPRKKRLKSWSEISLSHCLIKTNTLLCCFRKQNNLVLEGLRLRTLLESVLETTSHCLQISHTTCSLTTTTRTLQSPVVYACTNSTPPTVSHLRIGIATRSTSTLLNVVSTTTTSSANSVCLSVSFTKRRSTLSLQNSYKRLPQNFHKKPLFQIQEMQNSIKIAFRNLPCSTLEYSNTLNIPEDPDVQWFTIKTTEQFSSIWTSKPQITLFTISFDWESYWHLTRGKSSKQLPNSILSIPNRWSESIVWIRSCFYSKFIVIVVYLNK